jgi:hypothetical protein
MQENSLSFSEFTLIARINPESRCVALYTLPYDLLKVEYTSHSTKKKIPFSELFLNYKRLRKK